MPARSAAPLARTSTLLLAALAVVVGHAALTACGGEDSSDAPSTPTSSAADTPEGDATEVLADDIPVAFTPPGGYGDELPEPVLAECTEPLVDTAPDLRGLWEVVEVEVAGAPAPDHPANEHVERIEQCGDRLIVTGGQIIHDMRCDGTEENGVHDVAAADLTTSIDVVCTYEDGVHVLRPVGAPLEITRRLDGDQLVWVYAGFTARLDRTTDPADTSA